ncbi:MAG TPA: lysylphosphatidylglycerol synthase transmembrane domain-containing protein [Gemmata sp.]|nr:lysylphosphatidylglycerol synthase transmembrane domain-containing protein [Gemmata sp.]
MKKHAVKWIKAGLKYGIGFGLLAYVINKYWAPNGNNPGIQGLLQQTPNYINLVAILAMVTITTSIQFTRWFLLVRALDLPFTIGKAFRLGLVGSFWNTFFPGSVGGDAVKAWYIAHGQPGRKAAAVATVIVDRLVGLFGLIWFSAAFGGAFWIAGDQRIEGNDYLKGIIRVCTGLAAVAVIGWVILGLLPVQRADRFCQRLRLLPKIGHAFAEVWYAVWTYRQRPKVVYITIGTTAFVHLTFVLMFHLAVRVFQGDDPASFPENLVIAPIGYIAQAFFPAPGGVGGGEYIFGYLYELLGKPPATGVIGRLTLRLNEWTIGIIGLFVWLSMRHELKEVEEEFEHEDESKEQGT